MLAIDFTQNDASKQAARYRSNGYMSIFIVLTLKRYWSIGKQFSYVASVGVVVLQVPRIVIVSPTSRFRPRHRAFERGIFMYNVPLLLLAKRPVTGITFSHIGMLYLTSIRLLVLFI